MNDKTEPDCSPEDNSKQVMEKSAADSSPDETTNVPARELPEAAKRALAEAEERRKQMDARPKPPKEINGRAGPDPARYGDWENKGIASDF